MNSKEEWINVSLFDIDGCLHAGNCKTIDEVEEKNKTLFQTIAQRVKNEKFTKVIVGFATNRQDNEMDVINGGFLSLTCTKTLPHVQQQLANLLAKSKIPVLFDPYWMADLYSHLPDGSSVTIQRHCLKNEFLDVKQPHYIFDENKITLWYAHAHRVSLAFPNAKRIVIDIYDDKAKDFASAAKTFFSGNLSLLPKNVILNFYVYTGLNKHTQFVLSIIGGGIVDVHYELSVKYLASQSHCIHGDYKIKEITSLSSLTSHPLLSSLKFDNYKVTLDYSTGIRYVACDDSKLLLKMDSAKPNLAQKLETFKQVINKLPKQVQPKVRQANYFANGDFEECLKELNNLLTFIQKGNLSSVQSTVKKILGLNGNNKKLFNQYHLIKAIKSKNFDMVAYVCFNKEYCYVPDMLNSKGDEKKTAIEHAKNFADSMWLLAPKKVMQTKQKIPNITLETLFNELQKTTRAPQLKQQVVNFCRLTKTPFKKQHNKLTLLGMVAKHGDAELVQLVLFLGAKSHEIDDDGVTPLQRVLERKTFDQNTAGIVNLLLEPDSSVGLNKPDNEVIASRVNVLVSLENKRQEFKDKSDIVNALYQTVFLNIASFYRLHPNRLINFSVKHKEINLRLCLLFNHINAMSYMQDRIDNYYQNNPTKKEALNRYIDNIDRSIKTSLSDATKNCRGLYTLLQCIYGYESIFYGRIRANTLSVLKSFVERETAWLNNFYSSEDLNRIGLSLGK